MTVSTLKRCPRCDREKLLEDFNREKARPDGRQTYCRECQREKGTAYKAKHRERLNRQARDWNRAHPERVHGTHLRKRYGIEREDYDALLEAQGGRCAVCASESPGGRLKNFHVDHDHETGAMRGLLCQSCNIAIGLLDDDPELVALAGKYLTHHLTRMRGFAQ